MSCPLSTYFSFIWNSTKDFILAMKRIDFSVGCIKHFNPNYIELLSTLYRDFKFNQNLESSQISPDPIYARFIIWVASLNVETSISFIDVSMSLTFRCNWKVYLICSCYVCYCNCISNSFYDLA